MRNVHNTYIHKRTVAKTQRNKRKKTIICRYDLYVYIHRSLFNDFQHFFQELKEDVKIFLKILSLACAKLLFFVSIEMFSIDCSLMKNVPYNVNC